VTLAQDFSTAEALANIKEKIAMWSAAYFCPEHKTISKENELQHCDRGSGDTHVFHGVLYYSGEAWAREAILKSQDTQGGLWRSPQRQISGSDGSFGRKRYSFDQALGVLLYLVAEKKRDPETARSFADRWSSWIENHLSNREFSLCKWKLPLQEKDSCGLEDPIGGPRGALIRKVFEHVGAHIPKRKNLFLQTIRLGDGSDPRGVVNAFNTGCLLTFNQGDKFQCHLASLAALILQELGEEVRLDTLDQGFQDNPFSLWIQNFRRSSDNINQITLEKCTQANESHANSTSRHNQWAWERSSFERNNEGKSPWQNSFGWDCIAMINLLKPNVFVDAQNSGFEDGTSPYPYNTVKEGVMEVEQLGNRILRIRGGNYPETLVINQPMRLENNGGGLVLIGN
jgi:hypothetical protein